MDRAPTFVVGYFRLRSKVESCFRAASCTALVNPDPPRQNPYNDASGPPSTFLALDSGLGAIETLSIVRLLPATRDRRDLVFWYSAMAPYMADRFSALAARGTVNFECWFNRERYEGRSWVVSERRFPHVFIPAAPLTGGRIGLPVNRYAATRPRIIVTFHADWGVVAANLHALRSRSRLVFYVMKTFDEWTPRSARKETLKRIIFSNADGFLSPGEDADDYIRQYAPLDTPISRLRPVVQVDHYCHAAARRDSRALSERRRELGLKGFVFLNVGRMWRQKGIHTLLEAHRRVSAEGITSSLLLVGDGEDRRDLMAQAEALALPNVRFLDFVQQAALPEIYALGHAFVFPTRGDPYGIVVDEAMASGLPVISSDHAGELGPRVRPGENGEVVPIDDPVALSAAMIGLATDPRLARRMGKRSQELIAGRTIDSWVDSIEDFVADIIDLR